MRARPPDRTQGFSVRIAWMLAGIYGFAALLVMWRAPRVPYADGWRFLGHFARERFPGNVFLADNGHYEVLPNAVRVLEMHLFHADQGLQVAVGMALLLASLAVAWRLVRRLEPPRLRAAALLAFVIGLCWLGNVRTLAHGNETVHAYAVTLFLLLGIHLLTRRQRAPTAGDAATASLCGLLAALSFGSGIAVFAAFLAIALLRRASWPAVGLICGSALAALLLLRAGGGGAGFPEWAPIRQLDVLLRWLAAPWLYAAWPALDPGVAAQVPVPALQALLARSAAAWESVFGPVALSRWPHAVISGAGVGMLLATTIQCWRKRIDNPARLAGLALAWFALAVGGMVAVVRMPYFELHPEQVVAARYVVWSSLFWSGLGVSLVAGAARPARAAMFATIVALALLPSQLWMAQMAERLRNVAGQTAVAAAVGVVDPEQATGETVPEELAVALPAMRQAGTAVFAWPETALLGAGLPEEAAVVAVRQVTVAAVENLLGEPGRRLQLQTGVKQTGAKAGGRLLLVDPDGVVRGLAIPEAGAGNGAWIGWMRGAGAGKPVRAAMLPGTDAGPGAPHDDAAH